MAGRVRRGPGPSHLLLTPDHAGNVVGIDPHKRTLSATVADPRGGLVASEHFRVSGDGHRALEAWARTRGAGALTPARAFGTDFVLNVSGSVRHEQLPFAALTGHS